MCAHTGHAMRLFRFVEDYFGGPAGIGNEHIIGFYIDDDCE